MNTEIIQSKMMITRNGEDEEIMIDGYVDYQVDKFYGENADFKMGESHVFIDDISEVSAYALSGEDVELTKEETEIACEILGDKFLDNL